MRRSASFALASTTSAWNSRLASCAAAADGAARSSSTDSLQRRQVVVGAPLGGQPGDERLEQQARLEPLEDAVETEVGDEEAAVHLEGDEPVAGEPTKRLAHRAARDPEGLGDLRLAHAGARSEPPVDDHRADLVVGEPDDRAHAERGGEADGRLRSR